MKRFDLDALCADALEAVGKVIEQRYRQASYAVLDGFRAARSRCGHGHTVAHDDLSVTLPPFYRCPECSAPIWAEIVEWETDDGRPTDSGVRVACSADVEETLAAFLANAWDEIPTWSHFYRRSDWDSLTLRAQAWVRANVRVAR